MNEIDVAAKAVGTTDRQVERRDLVSEASASTAVDPHSHVELIITKSARSFGSGKREAR